jgi:hypothetical protein
MNLTEASGLLGWTREKVKIAIEDGIETPSKKLLTKITASKQKNDYDIKEEDVDIFLAAFESEVPGRYPPTAVRRELLVESGYQCAICKSHAPPRFHHIVDWADLKHHDPKQMLAVCGSCHDKIGGGIIDTKAQKEIKATLTRSTVNASTKISPSNFESLHCFIELDENLIAIGGPDSLILAIDEVMADLQVGREPKIVVKIKNYSDIKAELSKIEAEGISSQESRKRAFECREILQKYDLWDRRLDELFEEALLLIAKNYRRLVGFITKKEFATITQKFFDIRFASAVVSGVKFDVYEDKEESGFGVWITEEEANALAKNQGAPDRGFLTRIWGLDLFHLSHEILVTQVIPNLVYKYLWYKYAAKKPRSSEKYFFDLHTWDVGLG